LLRSATGVDSLNRHAHLLVFFPPLLGRSSLHLKCSLVACSCRDSLVGLLLKDNRGPGPGSNALMRATAPPPDSDAPQSASSLGLAATTIASRCRRDRPACPPPERNPFVWPAPGPEAAGALACCSVSEMAVERLIFDRSDRQNTKLPEPRAPPWTALHSPAHLSVRAAEAAPPQDAQPHFGPMDVLWASYVGGQDIDEVWRPTDLVSGYKRGPECRNILCGT
jgi:hypothetical protein